MHYEPLELAITSYPNDTFLFCDWILQHTDEAKCIPVNPHFLGIEELNQVAIEDRYDIIKVSSASLPKILQNYGLFPIALTIGYNNGPQLVIKRQAIPLWLSANRNSLRIGYPGLHTTATSLLQHFFPEVQNLIEVPHAKLFSAMESDLLDGALLIHEQRDFFDTDAYYLACDLGARWAAAYQLPLFLAAVVARRRLNPPALLSAYHALQSSLRPWEEKMSKEKIAFIQHHTTGIDKQILPFLQTYITQESFSLSDIGLQAVQLFLKKLFNLEVPVEKLFLLPEFLPPELLH
jgi:predicted solute-binding protein